MKIVFADRKHVVVENAEPLPTHAILDLIESQYEGDWIIGLWEITLRGERIVQPNPHVNNKGNYVWLVTKVQK